MAAATGFIEGKMSKALERFLKEVVIDGGLREHIAVADPTLVNVIKDSLYLSCVNTSAINELYRSTGDCDDKHQVCWGYQLRT